jgi:tetratricopeptide (TPR) repeat protein
MLSAEDIYVTNKKFEYFLEHQDTVHIPKMFDEVQEQNIPLHRENYYDLTQFFARHQDVRAFDCYQMMVAHEKKPNFEILQMLLTLAMHFKNAQRAEFYFQQLSDNNLHPPAYIYSKLITILCKTLDLDKVLGYYQKAVELFSSSEMDRQCHTSITLLYARLKNYEKVQEFLEVMRQFGQLDDYIFNALVEVSLFNRNKTEAQKMYDMMVAEGFKPTERVTSLVMGTRVTQYDSDGNPIVQLPHFLAQEAEENSQGSAGFRITRYDKEGNPIVEAEADQSQGFRMTRYDKEGNPIVEAPVEAADHSQSSPSASSRTTRYGKEGKHVPHAAEAIDHSQNSPSGSSRMPSASSRTTRYDRGGNPIPQTAASYSQKKFNNKNTYKKVNEGAGAKKFSQIEELNWEDVLTADNDDITVSNRNEE